MALLLNRVTRWPLSEILPMTYAEAAVWLETAMELEKEIHGAR